MSKSLESAWCRAMDSTLSLKISEVQTTWFCLLTSEPFWDPRFIGSVSTSEEMSVVFVLLSSTRKYRPHCRVLRSTTPW